MEEQKYIEKLEGSLRKAFAKLKEENEKRDVKIDELRLVVDKLQKEKDLLLKILQAQDEKILNLQENSNSAVEEKPVANDEFEKKVDVIAQKIKMFSSEHLSMAQEWIVEQVSVIQGQNKGQPVLARAIQEMFYANRADMKSKRHAFYHHVSRCVDVKRLGKLVIGNQMFLYIPIVKEIELHN